MSRPLTPALVLGFALLVAMSPVAVAQEAPGARTGDNVVTAAGESEGLPFSPAIKAAGMISLSGQIGNLPGTFDMPAGVAAQTRQAMENIKSVLEAAGTQETKQQAYNLGVEGATKWGGSWSAETNTSRAPATP